MIGTPSFRDVVEESVVEADTESTETQQVQPTATAESQEQTQVEVFAEKGELAGKTPEQLEQTYEAWQKAYTAKRQKETQELKEYQAKLAELEQKLATQPQGGQPVEQRAAMAQEQVELGNMTVPQYTEYIKELSKEAAREEYKALMSEEREQQLASKAVEQFQSADPRLNEHNPEFAEGFRDEVRREIADLLDKHLADTGSYQGFDSLTLAKQIVERKDRELDESIKKRTLQSTQAAKMREAKAQKASVRGSTANSASLGGNSIRDILSEAVDSAA